MADYIYKRKDGGTTYCYGKVTDTSNYDIACDDEYADGTYCNYEGRLTWYAVCKYLEATYNPQIEQLIAV